MSEQAVTHDRLLNGAVTIVQPARGYRAGMDAVLLAASLEADPGAHVAEAGTGAGGALLCAAHRLAHAAFIGFERDAGMAALAGQGIGLNGFGKRVNVQTHDVGERPADLENAFDQSFSNPPFFEPSAVRAPAGGKQAAYLAETPLKVWVLFLHYITRPGGRITMIHRAAALADILELLNPRAGEIEVMPVRPAPGAAAGRVLVRGRKGLRRGPVTLYEGLALHDAAGGPVSQRANACYAGGALEWR